jgi:hypothetical protein
MSNNDVVNLSNETYTNSRTNRTIKLYNAVTTSSSTKFNNFIMGGKYVDIFGTESVGGLSNSGFCGKEKSIASNSGAALVEFGFHSTNNN